MAAAAADGVGAASRGKRVRIMDGSTGYVLLQNGVPEDDLFRLVWSARALLEPRFHEAVKATHKAYLALGAEYITTNSYATQPTYYEKAFASPAGRRVASALLEPGHLVAEDGWPRAMLEHAKLSAELAVKARAEHDDAADAAVLGCLPPLVESHRPDLFFEALKQKGERFFVDHFRDLARSLLEGGVDMLIAETLNCWEEAHLVLQAIRELALADKRAVKLIVSYEGSFRDTSMKPHPDAAPDAFQKTLAFDFGGAEVQLVALGLNCSPPEDIIASLHALQERGVLRELEARGIEVAAYANLHERAVYDEGFDVGDVDIVSSEAADSDAKRRKNEAGGVIKKREDMVGSFGGHEGYVRFAREVTDSYGVRLIGGCCGCGPSGIKAVAEGLQDVLAARPA